MKIVILQHEFFAVTKSYNDTIFHFTNFSSIVFGLLQGHNKIISPIDIGWNICMKTNFNKSKLVANVNNFNKII